MEYAIRVRGHLDPGWSARLAGASIAHEDDGSSLLAGSLPDQAALHGVLLRLINLGLPLLSLSTANPTPRGGAAAPAAMFSGGAAETDLPINGGTHVRTQD